MLTLEERDLVVRKSVEAWQTSEAFQMHQNMFFLSPTPLGQYGEKKSGANNAYRVNDINARRKSQAVFVKRA